MSSREGVDRGCARWDIPQIDERLPAVGGDAMHAASPGYDDGYAQGRQEALAAGRQELQAQVAVLQHLMQSLTEPFKELDTVVETELLSLTTLIAQQVIRHELATNPERILAIIRESVALLPVASRRITLQLHPEDARLVREHLSVPVEEGQWQIVEDAACTRGGCVVSTGHARIDASVEQQVARIAETALGTAGDVKQA
ncbi:MAG: flagellar assembly protein FliH [Gammaproteobacteria bacterium]